MRTLSETMRWYGPKDPVKLSDIRQSGATGVVSALHEIPNGAVWPLESIKERKELIEDAGLHWVVVESVPVHEDIKTRSGDFLQYIENYKVTIRNLAEAGIRIICYNFMPVLDWTRTDLNYELDDGGKALRFQMKALAAFDLFILKRPGALQDYEEQLRTDAATYLDTLDEVQRESLKNTILAGLPGAEEGYSLEDFQVALERYKDIDDEKLSEHLLLFLKQVVPVAEENEVYMAIHPDDPPFPILGLPRVVSTLNDLQRILDTPRSLNNGFTFCTGSLGVRKDNDLIKIIRQCGDRIHFVHLRSTQGDTAGNFIEARHLEGDVPMYEVVRLLMEENDSREIGLPMRPDHGHQILDDLHKSANPGYTAIGRLKGLAEIRGLMHAIDKQR